MREKCLLVTSVLNSVMWQLHMWKETTHKLTAAVIMDGNSSILRFLSQTKLAKHCRIVEPQPKPTV